MLGIGGDDGNYIKRLASPDTGPLGSVGGEWISD